MVIFPANHVWSTEDTLCNLLPKGAPPLKPHRILKVTRKLETGQKRSGNTMNHLHQMNELMGRFCTHTHTQSLIAQTLWLKDNFLKSEGQHEILSKHVKTVTFLASKFEHQKSGEWVRGIFGWTLQHITFIYLHMLSLQQFGGTQHAER